MSDLFSATVNAALAKRVVRVARLARFDFASGTMRVWRGYGTMVLGGFQWDGIGTVGDVSGLDQAIGGTAPQVSISLPAALPAIAKAAANSWHEARGRKFYVYLQFYDTSATPAVPLDGLFELGRYTMETIGFAAAGADRRTVTINAENVFTARGMPIHGWLSTQDQQAEDAGDLGLERIPVLQNHVVSWPPA